MTTKNIPVQKNDDIVLEIDALSNEGQGIGRIEGFAVFVPGALKGETVKAHVIKEMNNCAVAKLVEVTSRSFARQEAPCAVYPMCGGCTLQHLSYAEQLKEKRRFVMDAFERIGGIDHVQVEPTLGMEYPVRYRNKGSFPFAMVDGSVAFGFFAPRSHRLIPFSDCLIQDERIMAIANRVCEWANTYHVSAYDEATKRGVLRHVMVRIMQNGTSMAVIVTTGALPHKAELLSLLSDVDSVWHNVNSRETNVIFGDSFTLLAGQETLEETIGELRFSISPQSFLQVNPQQTEVLYEQAVKMLAPQDFETVTDVYCGIGTISLLLAKSAGHVIGIESVPEAIQDANKNAAANGFSNTEFCCGAAEVILPQLVKSGKSIHAVMIDPPRKGCETAVLDAILESGANRMVYVSCNETTLARDCKHLVEGGFVIHRIQPVDMFPHTAHVETVVLMSRIDK